MNKIKPGSIPKIHTTGNVMKLRENAGFFQQAALAYGIGENDVFQAVDLFDKKNISQVTVGVSASRPVTTMSPFLSSCVCLP